MDGPAFTGRAEAVRALQHHLAQGERLVCVTGSAGVGKSRLVCHFAHESPEQFAATLGEGTPVYWCDCAAVRSLDELRITLASVVGAPVSEEPPDERLTDALSLRGSVLLVLDHVVETAVVRELVPRLLTRCRELRVVITARAPLDLDGEENVTLAGLDADTAASLWLAHGGTRAPPDALHALATRLGGNPLALDLVAHVDTRDPIERRGGAASDDPLRRALEYVWSTLRPREQLALMEASLFEGGFTLEAAQEVLSLGSTSQTAIPVMLADFRSRGLVRVSEDNSVRQVRFHLDPALREFAAGEFVRVPERDLVRQRYADYYLTRGEVWLTDHAIHGRPAAADLLTLEQRNFEAIDRAAQADAAPQRRASQRLRVAMLQVPLAFRVGAVSRTAERIEETLEAATGHVSTAILVGAWIVRGMRRAHQRHLDEALAAYDQALALGRKDFAGHVLHAIALTRERFHALPEALDAARRALETLERDHRESESARVMATVARLLLRTGATDEAASLFARAAARAREYGDARADGIASMGLGLLELDRGNGVDARPHIERAIEGFERSHHIANAVAARAALARLLHEQENTSLSVHEFRRAIEGAAMCGDRFTAAVLEAELGAVLHELGQLAEARAMLEIAHARVVAHDASLAAWVNAWLAATLASHGELDAAGELIEEALAAFDDRNAPLALVVRALRVFVTLVRAQPFLRDEARAFTREARHELAELRALPAARSTAHLRVAMRLVSGFDGHELLRPSSDLRKPESLVAARTGVWFTAPRSSEVNLRTRSTLSVLLRRLGEQRLASPGRSLSPDSLISDMWPGEKILPKAARNRLHVAVRTLRTMGLGTILRSNAEGYHLDPTVPFEFKAEA